MSSQDGADLHDTTLHGTSSVFAALALVGAFDGSRQLVLRSRSAGLTRLTLCVVGAEVIYLRVVATSPQPAALPASAPPMPEQVGRGRDGYLLLQRLASQQQLRHRANIELLATRAPMPDWLPRHNFEPPLLLTELLLHLAQLQDESGAA